jgi:hypothetical protein
MASIQQIIDNPGSTVNLLAENLPKSSIFFLVSLVLRMPPYDAISNTTPATDFGRNERPVWGSRERLTDRQDPSILRKDCLAGWLAKISLQRSLRDEQYLLGPDISRAVSYGCHRSGIL